MKRIIVNEDTGEVIGSINDGDRIVRAKSVEAFADLEGAPKSETFTKLYHKVIPMLINCGLSASELAIFLQLAGNLRYQSNVAKYRNGNPINRDNLMDDLSVNEKTVRRSIHNLIREGLIVEASTIEGKVFVVNPYVVMVGERINKTVYDLFRKSRWARW